MALTRLSFFATLFVFISMSSFAQSNQPQQTPILKSIDLPFNIDGYVARQSSSYGDWTNDTFSNGIDSGAVLNDNGTPKSMPLTYHINDLFNTPMSGSDDVFDGGNKTGANPTTWGWKYGGALNKDEMNNVNLHFSEDKATDEAWVVVSGDRYTTNGTSYIDFEFYQNRITAHPPAGGANGYFTTSGTACGRTLGDLLVTVEYTNGGRVDSIYFYRWGASSGASCGYDWISFALPAADAFGFSNDTTINVSYGAFGSSSYTSIQFVEAAINVTNLVQGSIQMDSCTGLFFESVFVKTKSSNSYTADLKDMIAPIQLELNLGVAEISYDSLVCPASSATTLLLPKRVLRPQMGGILAIAFRKWG